jgi:hypothetical protein
VLLTHSSIIKTNLQCQYYSQLLLMTSITGDKPVDHADAEMRATGLAGMIPGVVGAAAVAVAENNA